MTRISLIVETPRAGGVGHRFLTSSGGPNESEIKRTVKAAGQRPVGADYISVSRFVTQTLPNGTVREATECIVLDGVAVDALQPHDVERVCSELVDLYPSLEQLIAESDWSSLGDRSTVIEFPELQDWLAGNSFSALPVARRELEAPGKDEVEKPKGTDPKRRRVVVALVLVTCAGAILWAIFAGPGHRPPGNGPQPVSDQEERLRSLAQEWRCTPDEVARSLLTASNWDRRYQRDGLTVEAALVDGEILHMLDQVWANRGADRFSTSPQIMNDPGFRRFVESQAVQSPDESRRVREWLYGTWTAFDNARRAAEAAREGLTEPSFTDGFTRMLLSIAEAGLVIGMGEGFQEPSTPLFDRQDLMIYRLLSDLCVHSRPDSFAEALRSGSADNALSAEDLGDFLRKIRAHRNGIDPALKDSRARKVDSVREHVNIWQAEAVYSAYRALEVVLIQRLCDPP